MLAPELPEPPKYTPQEEEWAQQEEGLDRRLEKRTPKPTWKGPYPVVLTTPSALKVAGLDSWIHHSWVKAAHQVDNQHPEWKVTSVLSHPLQIIFKNMADLAD
ncbi:hypothetical protein QTO34_019274 [Cnephaeus nilssonii]|uniref:Murine leukemia virus integrase C-terminal domain-containing protein n=1 Tax=Cnephaeus nilssonii TaxID=3371016 RepID=A0AA40HWI5_CNENI|nr:hypothetical protein QTO34_019274 [Eptesicus nilssonii]